MKSRWGDFAVKNLKRVSSIPVFALFLFACSKQIIENSKVTLLSDSLPNEKALVFGKGTISTDAFEFAITFSPEMDEVFWTKRQPDSQNEIWMMKLENEVWSEPEPVIFKAESGWDFEPHINPQGTRLYFGSTRPLPDSAKSNGLHQWYCTRTPNGWSDPVPLESPMIEKSVIMYLTASLKENLFFTTGEKGDKPEDWVIYRSIKKNGIYRSIERMGEAINFHGKYIAHSYIAPDESYLIYDAKRDLGHGESDLYISFKRNGQWTKALNMGPSVNSHLNEMCPSISPDGRYLFFHRGDGIRGDIYWVKFNSLKKQLEHQSKNNSKK
ncbi:TolB family protein [Algoriphagus marincola]|jgi:Tol biopolymer transport system component|uniref:TolB family protein n=1 Tax=Algoriphagus marincola TaxID=264027 RepID=UPI00040E18A6|nr:PD40 domain-containing protein [Algoriphagus marincola]